MLPHGSYPGSALFLLCVKSYLATDFFLAIDFYLAIDFVIVHSFLLELHKGLLYLYSLNLEDY